MKNSIINWYKVFQALSLDVVFGAVIISLSICKYFLVQIPVTIFICLAMTIWLIYTIDHLLDAKRIKNKASTFRHQFHQKYQKRIFIAVLFFFDVDVCFTFGLPNTVFYAGGILVFPIIIYLLLAQRTTLWAKEIFVACIYTIGIFLGPICLSNYNLLSIQWLLIPQVLLLVFSNLLIFSWFDYLKDLKDGNTSIIIRFGKSISEKIIFYTIVTSMIFSVAIIILRPFEPTIVIQIIMLLMNFLLLLIFKKEHLFRLNDVYRVIGDGVFFIPLIFLLYEELR